MNSAIATSAHLPGDAGGANLTAIENRLSRAVHHLCMTYGISFHIKTLYAVLDMYLLR